MDQKVGNPQPKSEGGQSRYHELEAPTYLEERQNFYDQPPFREKFELAARKAGIEISTLRQIFTRILFSRSFSSSMGSLENPEELAQSMMSPKYETTISNIVKRYVVKGKKDLLYQAIAMIAKELGSYPYVLNYVRSQLNESDYKNNGAFKLSREGQFIPPKTYAAWATEVLSREHRQVLLGIQEVFPQDLSGESSSLPLIAAGRKSSTRNWRILYASELTRRR